MAGKHLEMKVCACDHNEAVGLDLLFFPTPLCQALKSSSGLWKVAFDAFHMMFTLKAHSSSSSSFSFSTDTHRATSPMPSTCSPH